LIRRCQPDTSLHGKQHAAGGTAQCSETLSLQQVVLLLLLLLLLLL
jgi:hypothetical protein